MRGEEWRGFLARFHRSRPPVCGALAERDGRNGTSLNVYLQFDGFDKATHRAIRGRDLRENKRRALDNCAAAGLTAIQQHPDRFVGLVAVGLQDPSAAVAEVRRAVSELGMRGVLVNDHTDGVYLDDPRYDAFWDVLEELDVPLYIHPGAPRRENRSLTDDVPELFGPMFTWGVETGGHALRLLFTGVFDRHPQAKVILGHMGEYLPFMLSRLDSRYATLDPGRSIKRAPSEYFGSNVHITISGVPFPAALTGALFAVGADAIMFAIDYPWEETEAAVAVLKGAALADADRAKIAHANAGRLLRIQAVISVGDLGRLSGVVGIRHARPLGFTPRCGDPGR